MWLLSRLAEVSSGVWKSERRPCGRAEERNDQGHRGADPGARPGGADAAARAAPGAPVEDVRRNARPARRLARDRPRRDPRAGRPERLRQVDADQDARRLPPGRPGGARVARRRTVRPVGDERRPPRQPALRAPGPRSGDRAQCRRQPGAQPGIRAHVARVHRLGGAGADGTHVDRAVRRRHRRPPSADVRHAGRVHRRRDRGGSRGWTGGGVLVLDEPTAMLPHTEVDKLLEIVREVRRGGTSVLYVSHRMDEIFDLADRVTVLRGGRLIGTRDVADLTPQSLATMMVGEDVDISARPEPAGGTRPALLEVRDLRAGVLDGVSFSVREGEVLGIAGLPGSGRETLPYAIAGAWEGPMSGTLRLPARSEAWIDVAQDAGGRFPLVPAKRTTEGVISAFSVKENLTLPLVDRLRGRAAIDAGREAELVDGWIEGLGIRTAGADASITTLSGGNQQKVVMARCLALGSPVLALCEPTAGVDIGTRIQLYELIAEQARAGVGVIVSSSDEGDLLGMCTRVLVLRRGVVATELTGDDITEPNLLHAMEGTD